MSDSPQYDPDRLLAQTPFERRLSLAGFPKSLWRPTLKNVRFNSVLYAKSDVSATAQRQWIQHIVLDPPRRPPFIVISSSPTDCGALYLAHFILSRRMLEGKNVVKLDAGRGLPPQFGFFPHVVLIHNVLHNATPDRIQTVRDLLSANEKSLRIVVVANEDNPYKWCVTKLSKYPMMVFKTSDIKDLL